MSSRDSHRWLRHDVVLAVHEAQIAEHGGSTGVRDPGLLESALARAKHAASYTDASVLALAALYALGIIRNHPFVDGNKRTGFVLLELFLDLNGYELDASDSDCYATIVSVASGAMSDDEFTVWVTSHAILRTT
ncbi:type II toxin-antitoxin system death-on-curing family toxin [bacterium]|nr:MAG: type II toxin-antitoxin system death-on-curing family toxin [bacterium]